MLNFEELIIRINKIRENIFVYSISELQDEVLLLIEELKILSNMLSSDNLDYFNQVLHYLLNALTNKDYLVLSDILKYELLPLLQNAEEERQYDL